MTPIVSECRCLPLARVQRERGLPFPGEVMVATGARVDGLDVIARATAVGQLRPIPLARYMQLNEARLAKHLLKQPGELVQARDIIASKPEYFGTLRRIYRAPGNGRIASLQGTWMTLDLSDAPFQLNALYTGTVVNVVPHWSVVIETIGALVQCAWGTGEGYGVLKSMVETPNAILTENKIDVSVRGAVLLAGAGVRDSAIRHAVKERAAGLIVGGLHPSQKELVRSLNFPTLVTEGFGERPMAMPAFQLLSSHAGEEIALNASMPASTMRPEAFIPAMPISGGAMVAALPDELTAQVGAHVRVIAEPNFGALGEIVAIVSMPQVLENGLSAWGAEVELNAGERVFVPWENMELIDQVRDQDPIERR